MTRSEKYEAIIEEAEDDEQSNRDTFWSKLKRSRSLQQREHVIVGQKRE